MTDKLTIKQTNFCQFYIECGNASEAYRQAYDAENMKPETINRKAKELIDLGKISARVNSLQAEHAKRHRVTVDSLTLELDEARELAKEVKNPSAAVAATTAKAKLHGLLIEKRQLETIDKTGDVSQVTDTELEKIIHQVKH